MTASAMENVAMGIIKFAVCSNNDFVLLSADEILYVYNLVNNNNNIFEPNDPIANTSVLAASFLYLFKSDKSPFLETQDNNYIISEFLKKGKRFHEKHNSQTYQFYINFYLCFYANSQFLKKQHSDSPFTVLKILQYKAD